MKEWLRRFLGLDNIETKIDHMREENRRTLNTMANLLPALNDLTVRLTDEFDPARKKLSDEIGRRAEARLKAEDWARRHTLGEV